jgi:diguanylate cyclase (GGDEF)-like protein
MSSLTNPFPPELESQFRAARARGLAVTNGTPAYFGLSASMMLLFSIWDWIVDPAAWATALVIRLAAVAVIIATGITQRLTGTIEWAPTLAKVRFSAAVLAVACANAVVRDGYILGLPGLVAVFLGGPYIVLDKRDYFLTTLLPLAGVAIVMFATGVDRLAVINAAFFLTLTIVVGLMLARVFEATNRRAFAAEQALMREARTDSLTRLANRRSVEEHAVAELRRQARSGRPTALVLCDIDHFKQINDDRGHDVGDRTICAVGDRIKSVIRATDRVGRWGGEEFLVVLPETTEGDAAALAERMRAAIEEMSIPGGSGGGVTLSAGVAAMMPDSAASESEAFDRLLKAADAALYRAKTYGRNRVTTATPDIAAVRAARELAG